MKKVWLALNYWQGYTRTNIFGTSSKAMMPWDDSPQSISIFTLERFIDSIFELVDIWTETTKESEYLELLDLLTQGITKVRQATKEG